MKKVILHLCADIGSDSRFFDLDPDFEVIKVGADIGVENFKFDGDVHGIIANPPCTEFSTADWNKDRDIEKGMFLVDECMRIIDECKPNWWIIENPATGLLSRVIGKPTYTYQPWQYGSPWTKKTALWAGGSFVMPSPIYKNWEDVPNKLNLWQRKDRDKPSLVNWHKSAAKLIPEFSWAVDMIDTDMALRSMCSQGFAKKLWECNR